MQAQRDGDGVGDAGAEVPVVEGFTKVEGNLGAVGDELFKARRGEVEGDVILAL